MKLDKVYKYIKDTEEQLSLLKNLAEQAFQDDMQEVSNRGFEIEILYTEQEYGSYRNEFKITPQNDEILIGIAGLFDKLQDLKPCYRNWKFIPEV